MQNVNKMKIFDHMNTEGAARCPVCKTKKDKPVILVPIAGTEEGNNSQAIQVHVDCVDLTYSPGIEGVSMATLYQVLPQ
jgi:hypothetical protein